MWQPTVVQAATSPYYIAARPVTEDIGTMMAEPGQTVEHSSESSGDTEWLLAESISALQWHSAVIEQVLSSPGITMQKLTSVQLRADCSIIRCLGSIAYQFEKNVSLYRARGRMLNPCDPIFAVACYSSSVEVG